ncbi:hypothetical protein [Campylobacter sp. MIT 99-7217]|nr:hypothetical protein [Campylobacter sp. MIT 99-7217]
MKNIILLGGSNSLKVNGLQKGLKEAINQINESSTTVGGGDMSFITLL